MIEAKDQTYKIIGTITFSACWERFADVVLNMWG